MGVLGAWYTTKPNMPGLSTLSSPIVVGSGARPSVSRAQHTVKPLLEACSFPWACPREPKKEGS